jgi:hypothetical protein
LDTETVSAENVCTGNDVLVAGASPGGGAKILQPVRVSSNIKQ